MTLDLERLFAALPDAYLALAADLTIVAANDAYLDATMTKRSEILGRPFFEVFPRDPQGGAPNDARASFERVLADRRPHRAGDLRFPIRSEAAGELEERWWRVMNAPVLGPDGAVTHILHRAEDITETRRLERESALAGHFRALLDGAPDAIVIVSADGAIQLVNRRTEALFGYAREQLVGHPLDVLLPERFRGDHASHLRRYFANPAARSMGSGLQLSGRKKDGSEMPIEVSLSPADGPEGITVSAAIRDVSERRQLEAAARLNAERLVSAVDSIEDALALFDAADRLVLANGVFLRLVHAAAGEPLIGKTYLDVLDRWIQDIDFPDAKSRMDFRDQRINERAHEQTATFDVHMRDGRSLRVTDRRTPEGGIVKTVWDLTDDERRAAELREAKQIAEAASDAKSDFLASMSHELRTPLNAILGFAQLLARDKREPLSERHQERAAQILRGGEHLLRLIDDILDLSRIESGAVGLSLEPVDVAEVLEEVCQTVTPIAARHAVTLAVATAGPLPLVEADRTRLSQIVMNLASNAIKYNRPNGRVTFALAPAKSGRVRITVTDTGIGIPLEKQERLFQPFQRAGQETGPIEGTGIGLVITKRLVELMQGVVGYRSVEGEGSSFWVELPVHQTGPRSGARVPRANLLFAGASPAGHHLVLYVEDNPANVSFMRDLVSSLESIELLTAPTAEIGIELAKARQPAVIIMDINLPGMNGLDALGVLRAASETKDIPVIALTAAASERDRQRGEKAGFHRYLTKPVNVEELVSTLEALLPTGG